jgi:hypothetical protein
MIQLPPSGDDRTPAVDGVVATVSPMSPLTRCSPASGSTIQVLYRSGASSSRTVSAWLAAVSADPEVSLLVRIHSECFTGDVLGSERCDCVRELLQAVRRIALVGVTVAERVPTAVQPGRPAEAHTLDLPCDDVLDAEA